MINTFWWWNIHQWEEREKYLLNKWKEKWNDFFLHNPQEFTLCFSALSTSSSAFQLTKIFSRLLHNVKQSLCCAESTWYELPDVRWVSWYTFLRKWNDLRIYSLSWIECWSGACVVVCLICATIWRFFLIFATLNAESLSKIFRLFSRAQFHRETEKFSYFCTGVSTPCN